MRILEVPEATLCFLGARQILYQYGKQCVRLQASMPKPVRSNSSTCTVYQRVPNVTTKNASNSWIGMQNRFLTAPTTEFILLLCATFLLPSSNSSKEAINLPQTVTVSAATTVTTISQPSPCIHLAVICTYVLYSSGHAPGLKPTACRQPGASTRP